MKGNVGTVTVSNEMRLLNLKRIQQTHQISSHISRRVASGCQIGAAVSPEVIGRNAMLAPQNGHHFQMPHGQVARQAVEHHHI